MKNVKLKDGFKQVCIWPGTLVGEDVISFENWMEKEFGIKVQYLEEIKTKPDVGDTTGETGNRNDLFFAVHNDSVMRFALPKLQIGARWIEDAVSNTNGYNKNPIYPERVLQYCTWNGDVPEEIANELREEECCCEN